jgi:hypothetical protein
MNSAASRHSHEFDMNHQADLKLPEANVRILGLNLLAALQVR